MTREELNQLKELYNKFLYDCDRVVKILKTSKQRIGNAQNDITYATDFRIDPYMDVHWSGEEKGSRGYVEEHKGYFDLDYLAMDNDTLIEKVKNENKEYEQKLILKEREFLKTDRDNKLSLYFKLKKELNL